MTMTRNRVKWEYFKGEDHPAVGPPYRHPQLYHVVVSFPPGGGALTVEQAREYRRVAYQVLRDHWLVGGVAVLHAGREHDGYALDGPHVHAVVLGCTIAPGRENEHTPLGDVVFKVIPFRGDDGEVRTWWLRSQREVRKVLSYLLTHCVTAPQFHSLTYFGSLSYNRFAQSIVEDHIKRGWVEGSESAAWCRCPYCGSENVGDYKVYDFTDWCRPEVTFVGPGPPETAELPLVSRKNGVNWA